MPYESINTSDPTWKQRKDRAWQSAIASLDAQVLATLGVPGAVADGVTDDAAAIQAHIDTVEAAGGGPVVLGRNHGIGSGLTVDSSHVTLLGVGSFTSHDGGSAVAGSRLTALAGFTGSAMLTIAPPSSASNARLDCVNVLNTAFMGASNAPKGLVVKSTRNSTFDVFVQETTTVGMEFGVVSALAESRDPQFNTVRYGSRHFLNAATSLKFTGDATANTSFNLFERVDIAHMDGVGIDIENGDNNVFINTRVFRAPGGSGDAVEFRAGSINAAATGSTNLFHNLSTTGAINARGTDSGTFPSIDNRIIYLDRGNGTPDPTLETDATIYWEVQGIFHNLAAFQFAIADTLATAKTTRGAITTETLRIYNGSDDHIHLTDGTNEWSIRLSSGDLTFTRVAGSGNLNLPSALEFNTKAVTEGAADSGGAGFKVLRVPN